MSGQTVYVAKWEHKHGEDTRIFKSQESAEGWRQDIAEQWWDNEMGDRKKPDDAKAAADEYFDRMNEIAREFYEVVECQVEN